MTNSLSVVDNTLPQTYDAYKNMDPTDRRNLTGQGNPLGSVLPRLKINYDAEVEIEGSDPISVPRGAWTLTVLDKDENSIRVYAKEAIVRAFLRGYRYVVWNSDTEKLELLSSIFKGWGDAVFDDLGNEFSGSKFKKSVIKQYPEFDGILKCQQVIYATVTLPNAVDMNKIPVEVVDVSALWVVKGSGFMPIADVFKTFTDKGSDMVDYPLTVTTKREKKGQVTYFVPEVKVGKLIDFTEADYELLKKFQNTINAENAELFKKFSKKLEAEKSDNVISVEVVSSDDLDADFNDDLPFPSK